MMGLWSRYDGVSSAGNLFPVGATRLSGSERCLVEFSLMNFRGKYLKSMSERECVW